MKPFKSREELYALYSTADKKDWEKYVYGLSVPVHAVTEPLYHMSFNMVPEGVWTPRTPIPGEAASEAHPLYGEMLPPRISVSTTLEGCWAGIFCYIFKDKKAAKELTAYIYKAIPQRGCRILTAETLSNFYLVQDAHLTNEYCLLGDVEMVLERTLTIKNTLSDPEKDWIKSNPFNEKRYGNVHYPPFIILNDEPNNQETVMSDFKLKPTLETMKFQISTEARMNPLSMLNEGMTNSFAVILGGLSNVGNVISNIHSAAPVFSFKPRDMRKITENNNYMQLMNYGAGVPPGFIGPLTPYMGLLIEMLNTMKNLRADVTKPLNSELGVILGNPERLRSATVSPLGKLNFHDKQVEAFKKRLAAYYDPKSSRDEIAFSRLFNDNSDFLKAGTLAVNLSQLLNQVHIELVGILEDTREASQTIDRLAIRITQDNLTYGVNAAVANDLSIAIDKVAVTLSFLASLLVMGEESVGILENLVDKIN